MKNKKTIGLLSALLLAASVNLWAQELPRLAVVTFTPNIVNDKTTADTVTVRNLAESQMVASGKYQVIARDDIDKILADQRIAVSAISSAENVRKLQLMNISYIVTGSVDAMGSDYAITVRVLDVSSGKFTHSDNDFMGGASRELYTGVTALMSKFNAGMSAGEGGAIVQGRTQSTRPAATGIAIEVSTKFGGALYFQNEEIATLWDNDTHTIPIERPGTYTVKMVFGTGMEVSRSVSITSRGVTKVDFTTIKLSYSIGESGPGGGLVFYDKGSVSNGWRYLEAAPANTEFSAEWGAYGKDVSGTSTGIAGGKQSTQTIVNYLRQIGESGKAAQRCRSLNTGGYTDWFLPSKDELDLMYKNLKQKGLGGFSTNWYWSSSQNTYSGNVWEQNFGDGRQDYYDKNRTRSVRAVRAF